MERRLYVCPVTGSGKWVLNERTGEPERDFYRAYIRDLVRGRVQAAIHSVMEGPERGKPAMGWTVCHVEAEDFSAVDADLSCIRIDEDGLDAGTRLTTRTRLVTDEVCTLEEATGTAREVYERLVRKHYPNAIVEVR